MRNPSVTDLLSGHTEKLICSGLRSAEFIATYLPLQFRSIRFLALMSIILSPCQSQTLRCVFNHCLLSWSHVLRLSDQFFVFMRYCGHLAITIFCIFDIGVAFISVLSNGKATNFFFLCNWVIFLVPVVATDCVLSWGTENKLSMIQILAISHWLIQQLILHLLK